MKDRYFIDTNILVYSSLQSEEIKHEQTINFLAGLSGKQLFVSTQVMSEFYVTLLKHKIEEEFIVKALKEVSSVFNVMSITLKTVESAWKIKKKTHFSYWDSLILSSALETECTQLITEDLHHKQIINNTLKIVNPFAL